MKPMTSKRINRIEKKKKKMAALVEVSKLNANDREHPKINTLEESNSGSDSIEPNPKRIRTEVKSIETTRNEESVAMDTTTDNNQTIASLKKQLKDTTRRKCSRSLPKFWLRDIGNNASLSVDLDNRVPLFLSDIQHLIMYAQLGLHATYKPTRWCQLDKHGSLKNTNVLVIDNMSLYHFVNYEKFAFPYLSTTFRFKFEIMTPRAYGGESVQELAMVPLSNTQSKKYIRLYGTLKSAVEETNEVFDILNTIFPVEEVSLENNNDMNDSDKKITRKQQLPPTDKFPRTDLLMSGWQMVEENYPLPIKGLMDRKYKGYVLTKDKYLPVNSHSPMFGIDCEMCVTTTGQPELTRVSIVDEKHAVVYDQLVKPVNKITNYLTRFSGITAKLLRDVSYRIEQVQEDIRKMLPEDAIIVGQSLGNDLHALRMMHPYVIDTSVIYNLTGDRSRKTKLQTLAREFLSMRIQEARSGHCSTEDCIASLALAQHKLAHSLQYGDAASGGRGAANQLQYKSNLDVCQVGSGGGGGVAGGGFATSMLRQVTKMANKEVQIVAPEPILSRYKYYTNKHTPLSSSPTIPPSPSLPTATTTTTTTTTKKPPFSSSSSKHIRFTPISNSITEAVRVLSTSAARHTLNLAHVTLHPPSATADDHPADDSNLKLHQHQQQVQQLCGELDTCIRTLSENSCDPSLLIVVFTGGESAGNGCCFVNVKWPMTTGGSSGAGGTGIVETAASVMTAGGESNGKGVVGR